VGESQQGPALSRASTEQTLRTGECKPPLPSTFPPAPSPGLLSALPALMPISEGSILSCSCSVILPCSPKWPNCSFDSHVCTRQLETSGTIMPCSRQCYHTCPWEARGGPCHTHPVSHHDPATLPPPRVSCPPLWRRS
jgi:hypothetical protein